MKGGNGGRGEREGVWVGRVAPGSLTELCEELDESVDEWEGVHTR